MATAAGESAPIAVSSAVTANMIHGMAATWPPTSRTAPRTSRSTVPLFCAIANRYVTPISVTTSSAGNPARMSSVLSPTDSVPTRNAATKASAPMLMGRNVAIAKITISAMMVMISGDTTTSTACREGPCPRPVSPTPRWPPVAAAAPAAVRAGRPAVVTWADSSGLGPGDRLPAERDLAARLGVSRATLAQALVALEVTGVVSVRHGDGTALLTAPRTEAVLAALRGRRRTEADLAEIDAAPEAMAAAVHGGGRGVTGDERFHAAVTAAAPQPLLGRPLGVTAEVGGEGRIKSFE